MTPHTRTASFAAIVIVTAIIALVPSPIVARRADGQTPAKTPAPTAAAKPSPKTQLPAPVAAAFAKAYPTATILHVGKEKEDGVVQYEIESLDQGRHRDVNYSVDGTLLVVEDTIEAADVPAAVSAAIAARYPKATINRRERVTERGAVTYEFGVKGGPVAEFVLEPDGTWVAPKPRAGKTRD